MIHTALITGFFRTRVAAEAAVDALLKRGYRREDISVLMSNDTHAKEFGLRSGTKAAEGASVGGVVGGTLGAILAAVATVGSSIALPGLGLVIGRRRVRWRGCEHRGPAARVDDQIPDRVPVLVAGDRGEPRREIGVLPHEVRGAGGGHPSVLEEVLGPPRPAREPDQEAPHPIAVDAVELVERARVARAQAGDELPIRGRRLHGPS